MNFTAAEVRRLILPTIVALVLTAAGAALIWFVNGQLLRANATFSGVKNDRIQARERLARISEEEREVKERIEVYRRLGDWPISGKERRAEWGEALPKRPPAVSTSSPFADALIPVS